MINQVTVSDRQERLEENQKSFSLFNSIKNCQKKNFSFFSFFYLFQNYTQEK